MEKLKNVDTTEELKIISLCTGYGGLDEGIRLAEHPRRVREVAVVEVEAFNVANLVKKMEIGDMDAAPIWTDLKTFDGEPFRRKVHGIIGGYPCQPFSHAGSRKGADDPRHLWPYIREIVNAVKPLWCFFENVEGHLSMGFGEVYRSLRDMGYSVEAGLFSAEEVGAPHHRKRLFILAYSEGVGGGRGLRNVYKKNEGIPGPEKQHEDKCGVRWPSRPAGEELADTDNSRGRKDRKPCELWTDSTKQPPGNSRKATAGQDNKRRFNGWPSRPGQPQHEWEHPRTATKEEIKSALGLSANGLDFRTDLLRSLGNGVVPATAEKAWIELWKTMNKN